MAGTYVDGFVFSVPKTKKTQYKKLAKEAAAIWKQCGALDYKECRITDATPEYITFTFPKMAKAKPDEDVWFSYIVYESKAHRKSVNAKAMKYFEDKYGDNMPMPFDMKRFAYGGFVVEVAM